MFTVYYLEIISCTKIIRNKKEANQILGTQVNVLICGFYIILFFTMFLIQLVTAKSADATAGDVSTSIMLVFMKNWFYKNQPWTTADSQKITEWTIFDFSYVTFTVIQFVFLLMNLFVAKETVLIFVHEAKENGFSSTCDKQVKSLARVVDSNDGAELEAIIQMRNKAQARLSYYQLDSKTKNFASTLLFGTVVLLALLPPGLLLDIWSVVCTVCCPLLATVLPGFFYYINLKQNRDLNYDETRFKCAPLTYAVVSLAMMPILLMLTMYSIQMNNKAVPTI